MPTPRTRRDRPEVTAARRELRTAERRYRKAAERAEDLRLERNAALGRSIDAGMTYAEIADATGLHRSRAAQIAAGVAVDREQLRQRGGRSDR